MSTEEKGPFAGKTIDDLGVTSKRALELHRKQIARGDFDPDIDGYTVPRKLGELAYKHGRTFHTLHHPRGDDEKVWLYVKTNGKPDVVGYTRLGKEVMGGQGLQYDVFAIARGPHEGAIYTSRIGCVDRDGLFEPVAMPTTEE